MVARMKTRKKNLFPNCAKNTALIGFLNTNNLIIVRPFHKHNMRMVLAIEFTTLRIAARKINIVSVFINPETRLNKGRE